MKHVSLITGVSAAVLIAGGTALASLGASAATGPIQYTPAGANSISGYYAHSVNDGVNFSHITSYAGTDGDHTLNQLPISTLSSSSGDSAVTGAAGIGLCNQQTGEAAQVGLVNIGSGLADVVDATGYLTVANNSDLCQGGIVNPSGLNSTSGFSFTPVTDDLSYTAGSPDLTVTSGAVPVIGTDVTVTILPSEVTSANAALGTPNVFNASGIGHLVVDKSGGNTIELGRTANVNSVITVPVGTPQPPANVVPSITWEQFSHTPGATFNVLLANVPNNDTVDLDILYDAQHSYTFKGHNHAAGAITFAVTDLSKPGVSYQNSVTAKSGTEFNEADTGVIADTQSTVALSGTPPFPNHGVNGDLNADPNLIEGFSHVTLAGNPVNGSPVVEGSLQANANWTAYPVAASLNGQPGSTFLGPTVFEEDHFLELVGAPVS